MDYITKEDFKNFYWIEWTDQDELITQLIKDSWFYFDLWNDLSIQTKTWRQRMYKKNLVTFKYHVDELTSARLYARDWTLIANLTEEEDYFIDEQIIDVYQISHFIEFTANIWYFTNVTIPDEVKSLIRSITKNMYDEYTKNISSAEVRQKTIWRFTLWYFEKKIEKTWLFSIIETIRSKYWIIKTNWSEIQFYMI